MLKRLADDGVLVNGDDWRMEQHCNSSCTSFGPFCGDGTRDLPDEDCDFVLDGLSQHCDANCRIARRRGCYSCPGWRADVYWDFSNDHSYDATEFTDGAFVDDNAPEIMILLDDPFPEGLAMAAGRTIITLIPPNTFSSHDYTPPSNNTSGPDHISDLAVAGDFEGQPYLLISSDSSNSGDGLYGIDLNWNIDARIDTGNNGRALLDDPLGRFDSIAAPAFYFSKSDTFVRRTPAPETVLLGIGPMECLLLRTDNMACVTGVFSASVEVTFVESITHNTTSSVGSEEFWISLAQGDQSRMPGLLYGVTDDGMGRTALVQYSTGQPPVVIASPATVGEWLWFDAVIPPADHVLGVEAAIYILEARAASFVDYSNYDLDRFRILRLIPP
ncbi:MAG: hypothetical protein R3C68_01540 [Myxococcota bacterium]